MPAFAIGAGIASLAGKAFKDPSKILGGVKKIGKAIGGLFGRRKRRRQQRIAARAQKPSIPPNFGNLGAPAKPAKVFPTAAPPGNRFNFGLGPILATTQQAKPRTSLAGIGRQVTTRLKDKLAEDRRQRQQAAPSQPSQPSQPTTGGTNDLVKLAIPAIAVALLTKFLK